MFIYLSYFHIARLIMSEVVIVVCCWSVNFSTILSHNKLFIKPKNMVLRKKN